MSTHPSFTPVSRKSARHDGWTEPKQVDFIAALAQYGMVRAAAEKVGMGVACANAMMPHRSVRRGTMRSKSECIP